MKQEIANLIRDMYDLQDEHFTVFIDVAGHINHVTVRTFNTGWIADAVPTRLDSFHINNVEDRTLSALLNAANADKAKGREWLADADLRKQEEIKQLKSKLAELEKSKC